MTSFGCANPDQDAYGPWCSHNEGIGCLRPDSTPSTEWWFYCTIDEPPCPKEAPLAGGKCYSSAAPFNSCEYNEYCQTCDGQAEVCLNTTFATCDGVPGIWSVAMADLAPCPMPPMDWKWPADANLGQCRSGSATRRPRITRPLEEGVARAGLAQCEVP